MDRSLFYFSYSRHVAKFMKESCPTNFNRKRIFNLNLHSCMNFAACLDPPLLEKILTVSPSNMDAYFYFELFKCHYFDDQGN